MLLYINLVLGSTLAGLCAWSDIKSMTIPNKFVYPAIVIGLIMRLVNRQYDWIVQAAMIFFLFLILMRFSMGGGDLKLAVALALLLGMEPVVYGTILASVAMLLFGMVKVFRASGKVGEALGLFFAKRPAWFNSAFPFGALMGPSVVLVAMVNSMI